MSHPAAEEYREHGYDALIHKRCGGTLRWEGEMLACNECNETIDPAVDEDRVDVDWAD